MNFKVWFEENAERLSNEWREHLSEMQDSTEHILMLAKSDACFEEWARDQYDAQTFVCPYCQKVIAENGACCGEVGHAAPRLDSLDEAEQRRKDFLKRETANSNTPEAIARREKIKKHWEAVEVIMNMPFFKLKEPKK